jgi:hypothetical protein
MQEQMATNPDMLTDMVKKNLTGMIPQLAMGFFVNFFFSGFVMGRVPFPLSPRFKPMLQRGIDLVGLDVTYFTALSYYILLLFGLQGVFSLVFREQTLDNVSGSVTACRIKRRGYTSAPFPPFPLTLLDVSNPNPFLGGDDEAPDEPYEQQPYV